MTTSRSGWVNPLRDPQDRRLPRIAGPCGMVLFGVTGDLSRKKVMPAISGDRSVADAQDPSTQALIRYYQENRGR